MAPRKSTKSRLADEEEGAAQEHTEILQPTHTKNLRRKSNINYSDTARTGRTIKLKYGLHNAAEVESILLNNSPSPTIKVEEMTDPSLGAFAGTRSRNRNSLVPSRSQSPLKTDAPTDIPVKKIFLKVPGNNRDNSTPLTERGTNSLPDPPKPKSVLKRGRENDDEGESVRRKRKKRVRLHSSPDILFPVSIIILPAFLPSTMYDYCSHYYHPIPSCRSPSLS